MLLRDSGLLKPTGNVGQHGKDNVRKVVSQRSGVIMEIDIRLFCNKLDKLNKK